MENEFTPFSIISGKYAQRKQGESFPYAKGIDDEADAFRHMVWQASLAQKYGVPLATFLGSWHENPYIPQALKGALGRPRDEREMDKFNNALGIEIAKKAKSLDHITTLANEYIKEGKVKTLSNKRSSEIDNYWDK
jgi:hypothetical protein